MRFGKFDADLMHAITATNMMKITWIDFKPIKINTFFARIKPKFELSLIKNKLHYRISFSYVKKCSRFLFRKVGHFCKNIELIRIFLATDVSIIQLETQAFMFYGIFVRIYIRTSFAMLGPCTRDKVKFLPFYYRVIFDYFYLLFSSVFLSHNWLHT